LVFCNPRWQSLCARQNGNPSANLDELASSFNESTRCKLRDSLAQPGGQFDSEVLWGDSLFQLRATRLPSTSETNPAGLTLLVVRSEEHTSELQLPDHLVCRILRERKQ